MLQIGAHGICKRCLRFLSKNTNRRFKWTSSDVRQSFIDFFCQKHDHQFIPSSSVIPKRNEGTYFTNAGMNQFKPIFLDTVDEGHPLRTYKRVVNSQKCIRVGGKHNDLEDVGRDLYHHTFFEMLGSWSFGDYFKKEACSMALELLTSVYKLPVDRLFFTYFGGDVNLGLDPDLETKEIWLSLGIPSERLLPFGMGDNFWDMGDTGPCGPCTEIHYDHRGGPDSFRLVNQGSADVLEIWNLVFMQYNRRTDGSLEPLSRVHVDTGMGLERMLAVMNQMSSTYNTDLFIPIFNAIQKSGNLVPYGGSMTSPLDIAYRIVADHVRMATVCIADGLLPGSKHQGQKLRSVLFRCLHQSKKMLHMPDGSIPNLVDHVANSLGQAFPEIPENQTKIKNVLLEFEDHYNNYLEIGHKAFHRIKKKHTDQKHLSDKILLDLFDGVYSDGNAVPVDLVPELSEIHQVTVDIEGLHQLLDKRYSALQQEQKTDKDIVSPELIKQLIDSGVRLTDDSLKYQYSRQDGKYAFCQGTPATILGIIQNDNLTSEAADQKEFGILLDHTIFYSEGGGQAADIGTIQSPSGSFIVKDVQKINNYVLHIGEMTSGKLYNGETVTLCIDEEHRFGCMKNHTATHILNSCLREMYDNVRQEGSRITPQKFTFEFTSTSQIKTEDLDELQTRVQKVIGQKIPIDRQIKPFDEALKIPNVISLPDEEYPSQVFTVSIGDSGDRFSTELCGGTHLQNTSDVGHFCITAASLKSQASKSITCVTGRYAQQAIECGERLEIEITDLENLVNLEKEPESYLKRIKQINKVLSDEILPKTVHDSIKQRVEWIGEPMKNILNTIKMNQLKMDILEKLKETTSSSLCIVTTDLSMTPQVIQRVLVDVNSSTPIAVVSSTDVDAPVLVCCSQDHQLDEGWSEVLKTVDSNIKLKKTKKKNFTIITISLKKKTLDTSLAICDKIQSAFS